MFSPIKLVLISALCLELNRQLQTRIKEVVTPVPMGKALMLQEGLSTTSICTTFMEHSLPRGWQKRVPTSAASETDSVPSSADAVMSVCSMVSFRKCVY